MAVLFSPLGGNAANKLLSTVALPANAGQVPNLNAGLQLLAQEVPDAAFTGTSPTWLADFTNDSGVPAELSWSRASTAWDFNAKGRLVSFASNIPRIGWAPDGLGNMVKGGLLIEEQRTNLLIQNGALSNAAWSLANLTRSTDTTVGPDGSLAQKFTASVGSSGAAGEAFNTTAVNISSGATYTYSEFFIAGGNSLVFLLLQDGGVGTKNFTAIFNLADTTLTAATQTHTSATGATLVGTSATYFGNGLWRVSVTASLTATTAFACFGNAKAATGNTFVSTGEPNATITTADSFYAALPQLELGPFATSPIVTVATAVTRSADIPSSTDAGLLAAQAWAIETNDMQASTAATILGINTGIGIQAKADNTLGYDSGTEATANTADWTAINRSFFAFDATPRVSICLDGGTVATAATSPVTPTTLYFGCTNNGASGFLNGRIRKMAAYASLTDAQGPDASTVNGSFLILGGAQPNLDAGSGAFSLTGYSATIDVSMGTASGAYALTGNTASLSVALAASSGGYSLTGFAVGEAVRVPLGTGSFTLTGRNATINVGLPAASGSFALTGNPASLIAIRKLAAASGSFLFTGYSTTLNVGLPAASGSFALTGRTATINVGLGLVSGAFSLVGFSSGEAVGVGLGSGAFALTGFAAGINVGMPLGRGSYTLTGNPANLVAVTANPNLAAGSGSFALTGNGASLDVQVSVAGGTFSLTGGTLSFAVEEPLGSGSYALTGNAADLVAIHVSTTLMLSGGEIVVTVDIDALARLYRRKYPLSAHPKPSATRLEIPYYTELRKADPAFERERRNMPEYELGQTVFTADPAHRGAYEES